MHGWRGGRPGTTEGVPADDEDALRLALEERRDQLQARVDALSAPAERGASQGFGKRIGDGTVEAISRLTDIGVGSSMEGALARTERSIAKLDEGTYGICDACARPIAAGRLAAMPDVVLCVDCAASERRAPAPRRR
jgi:DnaK suppressor protein